MEIEEFKNKIIKNIDKSKWIKGFFKFIEKENIVITDDSQKLALPMVISKKMMEILKILLENGAEIDKEDFIAYSIFNNLHVSQLLLKNVVNLHERDNRNVLFLATVMNEKALKEALLLGKKVVSFKNFKEHKLKIIQLLIDNGADINFVDSNGMSTLFMASLIGDLDTVELLLKNGANPNIKGNSVLGFILLMSKKLFELLLNEEYILATFSNFEKNKYDVAKLLIRYGTDVNNARISNMPLLKACTITQDIFNQDMEDLNIEDREKSLTFINSMNFGDIEVAKFLIEHGADVNIKYDDGNTFLYDAL